MVLKLTIAFCTHLHVNFTIELLLLNEMPKMQGNFITFACHCSRPFSTAQISAVLGTEDIVLHHSKSSSHCTALQWGSMRVRRHKRSKEKKLLAGSPAEQQKCS